MSANDGHAARYFGTVGIVFNVTGAGTLAVAWIGGAQVGLDGQAYLSTVAAALGAGSAIYLTLAARARRQAANPSLRWRARLARQSRLAN